MPGLHLAPMSAPILPCWICGQPATTGEHMAKRSDLDEALKAPSQRNPLFLSTEARKNLKVGSLDARALKPWRLCEPCNTARTQPYDLAWEQLSAHLASHAPPLAPGIVVAANQCFPADTARRMLDVHLYFAEQVGCVASSNGIAIDFASLST